MKRWIVYAMGGESLLIDFDEWDGGRARDWMRDHDAWIKTPGSALFGAYLKLVEIETETDRNERKVKDLAMLVRMLAVSLRRANPASTLPSRALGYLAQRGAPAGAADRGGRRAGRGRRSDRRLLLVRSAPWPGVVYPGRAIRGESVITKIFSMDKAHLGLCVSNPKALAKIMSLLDEADVREAFKLFGMEAIAEIEGPLGHDDLTSERKEAVMIRLRRAQTIQEQLFRLWSDSHRDIKAVFEFQQS